MAGAWMTKQVKVKLIYCSCPQLTNLSIETDSPSTEVELPESRNSLPASSDTYEQLGLLIFSASIARSNRRVSSKSETPARSSSKLSLPVFQESRPLSFRKPITS